MTMTRMTMMIRKTTDENEDDNKYSISGRRQHACANSSEIDDNDNDNDIDDDDDYNDEDDDHSGLVQTRVTSGWHRPKVTSSISSFTIHPVMMIMVMFILMITMMLMRMIIMIKMTGETSEVRSDKRKQHWQR